MAFRLFLLFALFMDDTGFCAEISVFVKTGDLVHLDIQTQQLPEFLILIWSNDKSENIITYLPDGNKVNPHPIYKDRVDFSETSFSLTLKNMQKNDSGVYRARISGISDTIIVTYRVSVIDEVEDPVLTNSSWSSPDPCNFTCEGRGISISYNFNGSRCSPQEVTSADDHTLRLNCSNDSIMCNYSNPVSFKTVGMKVHEPCSVQQETPQASASPAGIISTLVSIGVLTLILAAVISLYLYKRRKGSQEAETVYANPNEENIQTQTQLKTLEESKKPLTVYDTVRETGQTEDINDDPMNQSASLTENSKPNAPVTVYCSIQKQPNPPKNETDHTIYAQVNKLPSGYESAHPESEKN